MDGVLADFDGKVRASANGENFQIALQKIKDWMRENHPEINWRIPNDLKDLATKDSELKKLFQDFKKIVFKEAVKKDFFRTLDVMKGAKEILQTAKELSGELPNILTACVSSSHCESEKEEWMKKNFPGMYNKIYYEQHKGKFAKGKGDVLVDDRSSNIEEFTKAGGTGIHHHEEDVQRTIDMMKRSAMK